MGDDAVVNMLLTAVMKEIKILRRTLNHEEHPDMRFDPSPLIQNMIDCKGSAAIKRHCLDELRRHRNNLLKEEALTVQNQVMREEVARMRARVCSLDIPIPSSKPAQLARQRSVLRRIVRARNAPPHVMLTRSQSRDPKE